MSVKVLIIDDSALVRDLLTRGLSMFPGIEVVGTARDPYDARDKITALVPDVLTLDVEMPRMDGVEFLKRLMPQFPLPVVMVSALTERGKKVTFEALEAGAVDFVTKPSADIARGLGEMMTDLAQKVLMASKVDVSRHSRRTLRSGGVANPPLTCVSNPPPAGGAYETRCQSSFSAVSGAPLTRDLPGSYRHLDTTDKIVTIGASTGGTTAVMEILAALPADAPGVVVVQHMPPGFTRLFADRLDSVCKMRVREASDGDRIIPGHAYVAPGGLQTTVSRSGGFYYLTCTQGEKVNGHSPSVDVLMKSAATAAGPNAIGVILTGMGSDGAEGLLEMRRAGSKTIGQDEATSVVYGMPRAAAERGAVEMVAPLEGIAGAVLTALRFS